MARETIRWESLLQTFPLAAEAGTLLTLRSYVPFYVFLHKSSPQKIQVNGLPGKSRVHLAPLHCLVPRLCRIDFSLSVLRVSWSLQSLAFLWEMARKGKETHLRAYRHSGHLPAFNGSHKGQSLSLPFSSAS